MKKYIHYNKILSRFILIFSLLLGVYDTYAQVADIKDYDKPRNIKILREYDDANGNTVREIQYQLRAFRVTEMIIVPKVFTGIGIKTPINIDTLNKDSIWLMVNKTKYSIQIYYKKRLLRGYKAVFGPEPKNNKCMEGDRCTPEGWYKISDKHISSKYNKFLLLNYPNEKNYEQFNKLKSEGKIPKTARIGGDVGIHGIWPKGDQLIDLGIGWTDGCIAMKNQDVDELYRLIKVGTRVYIKK